MEATRNKKRRELSDVQDRIDEQRDGLIWQIEERLQRLFKRIEYLRYAGL